MGKSRFFLDISIDSKPGNRIVIETFDDIVPKTVFNFKCLCTGEKGMSASGVRLWYKDSEFHRIVNGFMMQGGDIGHGSGGESVFGGLFEDEELGNFEDPWLVAMANKGKDANGSQFFITTESCPHLNGEAVVFGHVISGFEYLQEIEKIKTNDEYYPACKVSISHCGELIRKKKNTLVVDESVQIVAPIEDSLREASEPISHVSDVKQDLEVKVEEISDKDSSLDSDYEYPSVVVPHFNEPKSYLERGGVHNWKPFNSIPKDTDGRKVKGRGNVKFRKPDSYNGSRNRYNRSRSPHEKTGERYHARSRERHRERSPARANEKNNDRPRSRERERH